MIDCHSRHQGEKGAEDVAAHGRIGAVEDGSGGENGFGSLEVVFDREQFAVAQRHPQRRQL